MQKFVGKISGNIREAFQWKDRSQIPSELIGDIVKRFDFPIEADDWIVLTGDFRYSIYGNDSFFINFDYVAEVNEEPEEIKSCRNCKFNINCVAYTGFVSTSFNLAYIQSDENDFSAIEDFKVTIAEGLACMCRFYEKTSEEE